MMVAKVLAEGKGIIVRWCPFLPTGRANSVGAQLAASPEEVFENAF